MDHNISDNIRLLSTLALAIGLVAAGPGVIAGATETNTDTFTVETAWADPLSDTSMVAGANLTAIPDNQSATVSVYYRPNGTSTWQSESVGNVTSTGLQYIELTDLQQETEYEYYARATTDGSTTATDSGAVKTFVTLQNSPDVVATGATGVNETAATLRGNVTDLGGSDTVAVYFEYRPTVADSWTATGQQTATTTGPISTQVSALSSSTDYEYRIHIKDEQGDGALSARETFRTDDPLTVETRPATDVGTQTLTFNGEITDFGGSSPETVAFDYRQAGSSSWDRVYTKPTSTGTFEATISELAAGTTYEYRAFASTTDGDFDRGSSQTVTTTADPIVTTGEVSSVGETTATVSGNLTSLGGADSATVEVLYRQAGTETWTATDNLTVSTVGSFDRTLSGLASGTDYEYRAVVTTPDGASDSGAIRTLSTDDPTHPPAVDSLSVRDVSPPNPHVELDVSWAASDVDGDLDAVTVTIRDERGTTVEQTIDDVAGATASGSLVESIKKGAGETYTVTVTVRDAAGETTTQTTSIATGR